MFDELMAKIDVRPENFGQMRDASTHASITGPCGDTVEVWLRIDGGKIRKGSFMSDGCGHSQYCCSVAVKLAEGMRPDEAAAMTQAQVLEAVGPIPEDHRHCALLAANTIRQAIEKFYVIPAKVPPGQRIKHLFKKSVPEQNHD